MLPDPGGSGDSSGSEYFPLAQEEGLSAEPGIIEDSAAEIERTGEMTRALNPNIDSAHRPAQEDTAGDILTAVQNAPVSTRDNIDTVLAATYIASGATRLFATDGVRAYNDKVYDIRSEWYTEKYNILDGDPESEHTGELNALKSRLQTRQNTFRENVLDGGADDAAAMLAMAATNPEQALERLYAGGNLPSTVVEKFPELNLQVDAGELPSDLAAMSDEDLATFLLDHPEFDPNVMLNLVNTRPEVVDIMGSRLADRIRDADIQWDTDEGPLQEYAELLQTWQDSSLAVTASLYEHLGAEDSLMFLTKLDQIGYQGTSDDANDVASVFRRGLGLADVMWDEQQQADFGRDLGQALIDSQGEDYDFNSAMAYLLDDQYYSTALLDPLGDKIASIDYSEHALDGHPGGLTGPLNVTDALFSSLGNNGEAALNFFDDPQRQETYLQDRSYASTGYENLLSALDSATTDETNLSDPENQETARQLFSSIAAYLGSSDEFHDMGGAGEGAEHMGNIISYYMADVDAAMYPFAENTEADPNDVAIAEDPRFGDERLAVLNLDDLQNLVDVAVSTEDGFENMRVGLSNYQNYSIGTDLADGHLTADTLNSDARLEGFFTHSVEETKIEEAEAHDRRVQAWIDMGESLIGAIPLPGAEAATGLAKYAYDTVPDLVLSQAGTSLDEAFANATGAAVDSANDAAATALSNRADALAGVLHDNGALTTDEVLSETDNAELRSLFQDGFPDDADYQRVAESSGETVEDLREDANGLMIQALSREISGSGVNAEDYAQTYKRMFVDYFSR